MNETKEIDATPLLLANADVLGHATLFLTVSDLCRARAASRAWTDALSVHVLSFSSDSRVRNIDIQRAIEEAGGRLRALTILKNTRVRVNALADLRTNQQLELVNVEGCTALFHRLGATNNARQREEAWRTFCRVLPGSNQSLVRKLRVADCFPSTPNYHFMKHTSQQFRISKIDLGAEKCRAFTCRSRTGECVQVQDVTPRLLDASPTDRPEPLGAMRTCSATCISCQCRWHQFRVRDDQSCQTCATFWCKRRFCEATDPRLACFETAKSTRRLGIWRDTPAGVVRPFLICRFCLFYENASDDERFRIRQELRDKNISIGVQSRIEANFEEPSSDDEQDFMPLFGGFFPNVMYRYMIQDPNEGDY